MKRFTLVLATVLMAGALWTLPALSQPIKGGEPLSQEELEKAFANVEFTNVIIVDLDETAVALAGLDQATLDKCKGEQLAFMDSPDGVYQGFALTGDEPGISAFRMGWSWMALEGPASRAVFDDKLIGDAARFFIKALHSVGRDEFMKEFESLYRALKDRDSSAVRKLLTPKTVKKVTDFLMQTLPGLDALAFAQGRLYMKQILRAALGRPALNIGDLRVFVTMYKQMGYKGALLKSASKLEAVVADGKETEAVVQMAKAIKGL